MRWRPRGRIVDSNLNFLTVDLTHRSSPHGRPRCADNRTASNSFWPSGWLTRSTHLDNLGIGHGESSFGLGCGFCNHLHRTWHGPGSFKTTPYNASMANQRVLTPLILSHLIAVHPGRQISGLTTPKLAEAARVSLNARGDGGTGWS